MDPNRWEAKQQARMERHRARWERRASCGPGRGGGLFWGIVIIAIGVLFLLRNLDIFYFDSIWQFWPVILIAVGVSKLSSGSHPANVIPGVIIAAVGVVFLLQSLDILPGQIWQYLWPGILIAVGLSMLARHLDWGLPEAPAATGAGASAGAAPMDGSAANRVHIEVIFGGDRRRFVSQDFEGGKVASIFGGVELDLRGVSTTRKEVVLQADSVFGGIEIMVPDTWNIDVRGAGVFGGYLDKTYRSHGPLDANAPRLIVKGGAVFGSVIVRN